MRFKGILVYITMFLLFIPVLFSVGTTSYPQPSGTNGNWNLDGRGTFASVGDDFDTFVRSLSNPLNMPVIDDLDNNSILEMIIVDGDNIRAYQNKELDIISTLDYGTAPDDISNILLFDIDGDGQKEIIFADQKSGTDEIFIFNFTQSEGLQLQNKFDITGFVVVQPIIACRAANECIVTIDSSLFVDIFNPFVHRFQAFSFDSTGLTSSVATIYSESQPSGDSLTLCSPRIKNIPAVDYDGDGNIEYILSIGDKDGNQNFVTYRIFMLDNLTIEISGSETSGSMTIADGCTGEDGVSNLFTPPTVVDIRTDLSNSEIYIGATVDDNEFNILVFASDGDLEERFPEILNADGVIISNVVVGNFFPETTKKDVCVLGYVDFDDSILPICPSRQCLDLLCGTESRGFPLPDSDEFAFDVAGLFNVSIDVKRQDVAIHSVQHSNAETDLNDLDEILNPYGVFSIDFVGANELLRIFQNPAGDSIFNSIDFEQVGSDDLTAMTDTNIFYFDDRISNEPAQIDSVTYNPCIIDSVVKLNTTLQVTVEASDTNDFALGFDDLTIDIFVYFGTSNQQSASFVNVTTSQIDGSTTVAAIFEMNETGIARIIRIEVVDSENPLDIAVDEQVFSVAVNGLEFGDSTCTKDLVPDVIPEIQILNISTEAASNEALTNFFSQTSNTFRISPIIVVLFLMLGWTIAVLTTSGAMGSMVTMNKVVFMVIGNVFILLIGIIAGAIGFGVLLTIIILSIVVIGLWVRRMFTSEAPM